VSLVVYSLFIGEDGWNDDVADEIGVGGQVVGDVWIILKNKTSLGKGRRGGMVYSYHFSDGMNGTVD